MCWRADYWTKKSNFFKSIHLLTTSSMHRTETEQLSNYSITHWSSDSLHEGGSCEADDLVAVNRLSRRFFDPTPSICAGNLCVRLKSFLWSQPLMAAKNLAELSCVMAVRFLKAILMLKKKKEKGLLINSDYWEGISSTAPHQACYPASVMKEKRERLYKKVTTNFWSGDCNQCYWMQMFSGPWEAKLIRCWMTVDFDFHLLAIYHPFCLIKTLHNVHSNNTM